MVVLLAIIATVPLANFIATSASRTLFLSRSNDADWFATMAEAPLQSGDIANLREMAVRYDDLYNTPVFIVDDNNKVVATSKSGVDTNEPDIAIALGSTLAGRLPAEPPALWPWQSGEMVVARPVANNGRILGAAVLRVPTDDNRLEVRRSLILLLIGLLISIGAIIAGIVRPISRWVINPVKDLDNATHQITRGALDTRVSTDGRAPELRRLGDSFNSMALSLHQARQREREFVADASHQLRTPLTSARIHIEGLSRLSPTARFALSDIDRLGRIVQRLSRLAGSDRPGADAEGNSEEPLDLAQAVKERLVGWKAVYAADDLELIIGDMVPGGVAPELEVDDILDVLLDNASKYGAPPVEVSVTRDGTEVVLSVRDHGLGLGSRDLKKVGERFWRSAHHREMPGTGLGLAIVRSEAARVGGRVVARPPIGGGLVIEVRVPLIDDYEL
ncbi:sensor histidine kinase [Kribbella albertanoniae]|uniref:Signal transduction histidine-protein kinase/phosphatase MprB n=1 Tax=Kribbella albertanoniae TaxID=1266829 RepID=A0A4R4PA13_9ACTN|nr:HAMP domain-containing sensor histidine kinase [Kribbella albertanoniae]TDC17860.1 HAMP domain-containing histidine kinase [Kribbella albertanoniae]